MEIINKDIIAKHNELLLPITRLFLSNLNIQSICMSTAFHTIGIKLKDVHPNYLTCFAGNNSYLAYACNPNRAFTTPDLTLRPLSIYFDKDECIRYILDIVSKQFDKPFHRLYMFYFDRNYRITIRAI